MIKQTKPSTSVGTHWVAPADPKPKRFAELEDIAEEMEPFEQVDVRLFRSPEESAPEPKLLEKGVLIQTPAGAFYAKEVENQGQTTYSEPYLIAHRNLPG